MSKDRLDEAFTEIYLDGIENPCYVVCDHYYHQPPFRGSPHLCDSSDDYYGWTDFEITIYDEDGNDLWEMLENMDTDEYNNLYSMLLKEYEDLLVTDYEAAYGD